MSSPVFSALRLYGYKLLFSSVKWSPVTLGALPKTPESYCWFCNHAQPSVLPSKPSHIPHEIEQSSTTNTERREACFFISKHHINTNFLQKKKKCFVIPLKNHYLLSFPGWHVVISAWLFLMQFNLILLKTSYFSYICLIIQQLIGISHNCWYEKDNKKYSSPYIPWFIWAGHESHILKSGKCLQTSPFSLEGRGWKLGHQYYKPVHKATCGQTELVAWE